MGERPPCDLPIPCASISALGERKVVFSGIPDNTVGASGGAECLEQGGEGMLYPFIRIHDGSAAGVIDIANRQREAQFSPGSGVFLPANHTGVEEVEFRFAHGAFQADQEPVVKV